MSGFVNPNQPNLPDFLDFLSTSVQIPSVALPDDSPFPGYALAQAIELVLQPPSPWTRSPPSGGILYTLAVYNCATHILFVITPDQEGQTYFATMRGPAPGGFNLNAPSSGIVVSSSDNGSAATLAQPTWGAGLTVTQLGFFKTPWGREYLGFIQSYGPSIVGLT